MEKDGKMHSGAPYQYNMNNKKRAIYCVKVGHSFLWCDYVLHVVHQTNSLFSLPLFWLS